MPRAICRRTASARSWRHLGSRISDCGLRNGALRIDRHFQRLPQQTRVDCGFSCPQIMQPNNDPTLQKPRHEPAGSPWLQQLRLEMAWRRSCRRAGYDIRRYEETTKRFAIAIVRFAQTLPTDSITSTMARQLVKSGTSVGANY